MNYTKMTLSELHETITNGLSNGTMRVGGELNEAIDTYLTRYVDVMSGSLMNLSPPQATPCTTLSL